MPPANTAQQEIDFSKYRKPELADRISTLLNIPRVLKTMLRCCSAATFVFLLLFVWALVTLDQRARRTEAA